MTAAAVLRSLDGQNGYWLKNATLPACLIAAQTWPSTGDELVTADLQVASGRIAAIVPAGQAIPEPADHLADLDGGMVWPCFTDLHTHLDKGHIWPRRPNPDGSFDGALKAVTDDRTANWTAGDVRARMEFALRCAYVHGTSAIRTHLDSVAPQHDITWPVFDELRAQWHDRITLQGSALFGIELATNDAYLSEITATVARYGGILGCVTYPIPELDRGLENIFAQAAEHQLDLDFHADETADPQAIGLRRIAEIAIATSFAGKIVVGHCCSLARQATSEIKHTLDRVAQAGITIVSLPMCNMYLQDREAGRTPRWRGVTLAHEMTARGIPVAIASDNTRDPFYAYGDLDMVEVYREATRIMHLDHPIADWPASITTTPAQIMGLEFDGSLQTGAVADLVCFRARNWSEWLSRPQSDRIVLRNGAAIDQHLPDYRELDELLR